MSRDRTTPPRSLIDFLDIAQRNEKQVLIRHSELFELLERLNRSFEKIFAVQYLGPQVPGFLVMTAYGYFMSAVRLAVSGQMPPVFPLLRAGIEGVLFALLMVAEPKKIDVWLKRGDSKSSKQKCRDAFTGKIGLSELSKRDPELSKTLGAYYDSSIDFGAHPNVSAMLPHFGVEDKGTHWLAMIRTIHSSDSQAVVDTLASTIAAGGYMIAVMSYVMTGHEPAKLAYNEAHDVLSELDAMMRAWAQQETPDGSSPLPVFTK
ncbi:hypothetical protein [Massilia suwonensis]|uniref:Uncharacterized protein n=1 Tax=Massilia suwonensis TaxID=648895 RepID=A0ABW0MSI8_9BURK